MDLIFRSAQDLRQESFPNNSLQFSLKQCSLRRIFFEDTAMTPDIETLIEKLQELSVERRAEVADFVDFLLYRERGQGLTQEAEHLAQTAFTTLWDTPADTDYPQQ